MNEPLTMSRAAFGMGSLSNADCDVLRMAAARLTGAYAVETYADHPNGEIWATIEPINVLAKELRFSFGRAMDSVVLAVRRPDGTRIAHVLPDLDLAIDAMNSALFDFRADNGQCVAGFSKSCH
jgi:hypothetical protein